MFPLYLTVMISRTLGPEFGGAIGALFIFANIVSSALYITGCVEGILDNFGKDEGTDDGVLPIGRWWIFLYCSIINLLNLCVCLIGASLFAKTSVAVLAIVGKLKPEIKCACKMLDMLAAIILSLNLNFRYIIGICNCQLFQRSDGCKG